MKHEIGRKIIGGIAGHEHFHPTGEQICLKCGLSLQEIIEKQLVECDENILKQNNLATATFKI